MKCEDSEINICEDCGCNYPGRFDECPKCKYDDKCTDMAVGDNGR